MSWFNQGCFSQDPTKRCKKFKRASLNDPWPEWAYSTRKIPNTNTLVQRYHGMWIPGDYTPDTFKTQGPDHFKTKGWWPTTEFNADKN